MSNNVEKAVNLVVQKTGLKEGSIIVDGARNPSSYYAPLFKALVIQKVFPEIFDYILYNKFGPIQTENGLKEYHYKETTPEITNKDWINDLTAEDLISQKNSIKQISELFQVDTSYSQKESIPKEGLIDWDTNPETASDWIATKSDVLNRAFAKNSENRLWKKVLDEGFEVSVDGDINTEEGSEALHKKIYEILTNFQTTSKSHMGIGNNGDGIITINSTSVSPELKFNPDEFWLITSTKAKINITFNNDATYFNWEATQLPINSIVLDFDKYSGTTENIKVYEAFLIHKDSLEMLEQYMTTFTQKMPLYDNFIQIRKNDIYKLKNKPIIKIKMLTPV